MESMTISPLPVNSSENTSEYSRNDGAGAIGSVYYFTMVIDAVNSIENTTEYWSYDGDDYVFDVNDDDSNDDGDVIESAHYFAMVIYTVAFLLGTTGNGLVIWIAGFKMKKTVNVVWFLNLAIADFIFTFFLPLSITYTALGFHWPFGTFMCKFNIALEFLNMFASIFTLTVISLDRFVCVMFPVWAQNHRTLCLASIISIVIWSFPFCFSLTYFIFRDTYQVEDGPILCYINFSETDKDLRILRLKALVIVRFIFGFFFPFTIIVTCYIAIAWRLHRNHMTTSSKPFKVIVAVMTFFFLCWFPYHIIALIELYAFDNNDRFLYRVVGIATPVASSLVYLNSCVNPFLYVFIGRDFKARFRTSIQSVFERAFMEDTQHTDLKNISKSSPDSVV